jgi:hypothetical protein
MRMKSNKDLSQTSCIKINKTNLGGFWDGKFLNYISIDIKSCLNTTKNNFSCIPKEIAHEKLFMNSYSYNVYTGILYTELSDYENPLKLYSYNIFKEFDPLFGRNIILNYKVGTIKTDMGIITDKSNNYSLIGLDSYTADVYQVYPSYLGSNNYTTLANFELYFGKNIDTFEISYIKLQQVIANIGVF